MNTDFTKIKFAGEDMIMVTIREKAREPILLLDRRDILKLNEEWNNNQKENVDTLPKDDGSLTSDDNHTKILDITNKDYGKPKSRTN